MDIARVDCLRFEWILKRTACEKHFKNGRATILLYISFVDLSKIDVGTKIR